MPRINGRSLEEVRRYDLFKLAVAVLLFIAWLFFTDRVPMAPTGSAGVSSHADASAVVDALPSRLRIESVDGRIHLRGSVPDEATRNDYLAAARKALGRPDRVDDGLGVVEGAGRPDWLSHAGPAMSAIASRDGVSATIDGEQVVLEGSVADEAQRTELADQVTAAFGAPFTVVNRLAIADSAPAAPSVSPATAALPASMPSSSGSPASASGAASPLQVVPAAVSVFFEEGVTTVESADGEKLAPLARHAREAGVSLRVSGFHSKTGSVQRNAEIAKERAVAVRALLIELGVAADRVILDKPRETLSEEDNRRARRVDVGIDGSS